MPAGYPAGTVGAVVLGTYREFFAAIASAAAALTGLLFVALSVAPRSTAAARPAVIREVRAAAALLSFTNALTVSLFGLVPGNTIRYPATVMGVIGIFFTVAGIRSIYSSDSARRHLWRQLGLIVVLLLVFGFELAGGIDLIVNSHLTGPVQLISNVLVASLLIGVARAWELVGDRDTGIVASIAVLTRHAPSVPDPAEAPSAKVHQDPRSWPGPRKRPDEPTREGD